MAITGNFLYRRWLLIQPYEKEEANSTAIEQMNNIWINQSKSKLLASEFKTKPSSDCFGQFTKQSYKIAKQEHKPLSLLKEYLSNLQFFDLLTFFIARMQPSSSIHLNCTYIEDA